jgi:hypothetical protein
VSRAGFFGIVCVGLLCGLSPVWAQPAANLSREARVAHLAASSTLVVRGRVQSTESRAHEGAIYTYTTVTVDEVLKGPSTIRTLTVKTLGGATDSLVLQVADAPTFAAGDESVLFLAPRVSDGSLYPVGLGGGVWPVHLDLTGQGLQVGAHDVRGPLDATFRDQVAMSPPATAPYTLTPPEWSRRSQPQYTFLTTISGGPARWHQADDGSAVVVHFQTGASTVAIDGAIALWNAAGSVLTLTRGVDGPTPLDRKCAAFTGSGTIELSWSGPCEEIAPTDTATVGIGGGYFTPGRTKTVGPTTFEGFVQGIAILNPHRPDAGSSSCTLEAVAHLLGHAVGLGHSDVSTAIMAATPRASCTSTAPSLDADDLAGIRAIYASIASGPRRPDAPTAMSHNTLLSTVTLQWTPAVTGGPAQAYAVEAAGSPGGPNFLHPPFTTTASSLTVGGVPPGTYYVRVRATNPFGTSGVSPETQVVVGPCALPSAPAGFVATVDGLSVAFTWTAPPSGIVQSYRLSAGYAPGRSDAAVVDGLTTTSFGASAPEGRYYVRIAAANVCGVGPTTPDTLVQLRSCTAAPQPPTNLRATTSNGLVRLVWDAPATGDRPSRYRITAGLSPTDLSLLGGGVFTSDSRPLLTASAGPGTYHVQIFSTNACGDSGPSLTTPIIVSP